MELVSAGGSHLVLTHVADAAGCAGASFLTPRATPIKLCRTPAPCGAPISAHVEVLFTARAEIQ
jgi:hypothetical protein